MPRAMNDQPDGPYQPPITGLTILVNQMLLLPWDNEFPIVSLAR